MPSQQLSTQTENRPSIVSAMLSEEHSSYGSFKDSSSSDEFIPRQRITTPVTSELCVEIQSPAAAAAYNQASPNYVSVSLPEYASDGEKIHRSDRIIKFCMIGIVLVYLIVTVALSPLYMMDAAQFREHSAASLRSVDSFQAAYTKYLLRLICPSTLLLTLLLFSIHCTLLHKIALVRENVIWYLRYLTAFNIVAILLVIKFTACSIAGHVLLIQLRLCQEDAECSGSGRHSNTTTMTATYSQSFSSTTTTPPPPNTRGSSTRYEEKTNAQWSPHFQLFFGLCLPAFCLLNLLILLLRTNRRMARQADCDFLVDGKLVLPIN